MQFKKITGYFLKNNVKLPKEINFFTINSGNKLSKLLGVAKIMTNTVGIPDFNTKIMIAIAMAPPSKNLKIVAIKQLYMIDSSMYIEYEVREDNLQELGYFVCNLAVFEIEKPKVIVNVCFIDNEKNTTVISFGDRNINSPESVAEVLQIC